MQHLIPDDVVSAAQQSQRTWHVPASVTLAQWILESAWGTRPPHGSNNVFGIKAPQGARGTLTNTHEEVHGRLVLQQAQFANFLSIAQCFDAHGRLLAQAKAYAPVRKFVGDAKKYAAALTGIYATDSQYGEKLIGLMDQYKLESYDVA